MTNVSTYIPTVGLEIHTELKTQTKMFCDSKNSRDNVGPNVNICPICLAHPGTLPVINKEAIAHVLRVGVAINGKLAEYTEFDRKNYFYPDLPKGYQISQFEHPLVSGGSLNGVSVTRIHLEEDTARSEHDPKTEKTLIDFNRAGVPLMELVTAPVIHSAKEAGNFAKEFQLLLRYLGASDANMDKGEMRVEANISIAPIGELGTKVEIKNLNSFRSVECAIAYEIKRQTGILVNGGLIRQETMGWNEGSQKTFLQRVKEVSSDYRYFPDPDLPKLLLSACASFSVAEMLSTLPELPQERRKRYLTVGVSNDDAELYVQEPVLGDFFDKVIQILGLRDAELLRLASNYVATDLVKLCRDYERQETEIKQELTISPIEFSNLIRMIVEKKVSSRGAKDILALLFKEGGSSSAIAKRESLYQKSEDKDLLPIVIRIISDNLTVVNQVRSGKHEALQFLIGKGMKETKGSANPQALKELLVKEIATLEQ